MTSVIICLTGLIFISTLLPLSRHPHWIIRGMDFPRLQFFLVILVMLIVDVLFLDMSFGLSWLIVSVTTMCLLWQLWWILPYTRLWHHEVKKTKHLCSEREISIMTANVLTTNRQADLLIQLVKEYKPDVLVTLETDMWWQEQLTAVDTEMPYNVKCPQDNLYGMHVFSRLPLQDSEISFLVEDSVPSIHSLVTLRSGDSVRMHFLHPAPPSPTENIESAERDAELVIVARSVAESEQPIIVTGDLNDVAWSATTRLFRRISGLLDPRVGRGMFNTFHADFILFRWPLDHLFHSHHFTLNLIKRLPSIGSDHFPLLTKLTFSPLSGEAQEGLDSNDLDKSWGNEIVEDQNVNKDDVAQPRS